MLKRWLALIAAFIFLFTSIPACAEDAGLSPREEMIEAIIETGRQLFIAANGKLQRAQKASRYSAQDPKQSARGKMQALRLRLLLGGRGSRGRQPLLHRRPVPVRQE